MSKLDWFAALHEGNCVTIDRLLDKDERKELLFMCPDESEAERMESGWKGCNAMHVAVKQGCSQLVRRIIDKSKEYVDMSRERSNMNPTTRDPCKSLGDMILAVEGNCKLDTIAIALLNGDRDVTWLLAEALLVKCRSNPYGIKLGSGCPVPSAIDEDKLERIRQITKKVLEEIGNGADRVVQYYEQQCEFNFLQMDEYLFLALCTVGGSSEPGTLDADVQYLFRCWRGIVRETLKEGDGRELLMFLFELKDGRGRTALHVGIDHQTIRYLYLLLGEALGDGFATKETTHLWAKRLANTKDRAGRTPLHRAAAAPDFPMDLIRVLLEIGADVHSSFEFITEAEDCFVDVRKVSARNGFASWFPLASGPRIVCPPYVRRREYFTIDLLHKNITLLKSLPITVIHLAIFNPSIKEDFLMTIMEMIEKEGRRDSPNKRKISLFPFVTFDLTDFSSRNWTPPDNGVIGPACAPLGLAALVGNIKFVRHMLWYDENRGETAEDGGKINTGVKAGLPGLLLAAAVGDSLMVQTILKSEKFDHKGHIPPDSLPSIPLTALHAAVRGWSQLDGIGKHLLHVVNFRDGWCKKVKDFQDDPESDRYSRQACVNLLLQTGASVWDTFGRQDAPQPGPGTSPEFRAWWSERVERETQEMKTSLTTAANAISVTAALVATASYIGPLQPPMGYGVDETVQVEKVSVKLFIIFDTLAFYVALSAIVLAMIPSLPMPTESVQGEGKRARKSVLFAVSLLVISLVCILVAFAAASIAIISNDGSWNQGGVTISTVAIGGSICTLTISWFVKRLWRLVESLVLTSSDECTTLLGYGLFSFSNRLENLTNSLENLMLVLMGPSMLQIIVCSPVTTPLGLLLVLVGLINMELREYVKKHL